MGCGRLMQELWATTFTTDLEHDQGMAGDWLHQPRYYIPPVDYQGEFELQVVELPL